MNNYVNLRVDMARHIENDYGRLGRRGIHGVQIEGQPLEKAVVEG